MGGMKSALPRAGFGILFVAITGCSTEDKPGTGSGGASGSGGSAGSGANAGRGAGGTAGSAGTTGGTNGSAGGSPDAGTAGSAGAPQCNCAGEPGLCRPNETRACQGGTAQDCDCDGGAWLPCYGSSHGHIYCDNEFGCNCVRGNPGPCEPGKTRPCSSSGALYQQCSCDGTGWGSCETQDPVQCDGGS